MRYLSVVLVTVVLLGGCSSSESDDEFEALVELSRTEALASTTTVTPTSSQPSTTTTTTTTTTTAPTTTTTIPELTFESAECEVFRAGAWFASIWGDYDAFNTSPRASEGLGVGLFGIGAATGEMSEQILYGTQAFSLWLLKQLKTTVLFEDGELMADQILVCADVPGIGITFTAEDLANDSVDTISKYAQLYAGQYDLPGKELSGDEVSAEDALLDPDGDGIYYTHSGSGDSEDFLAPAMFRVTYTGTAQACAFYLVASATGEELEFVSGLDGGGMVRLNLSISKPTEVYVSEVIGCRGGELQFGPNP